MFNRLRKEPVAALLFAVMLALVVTAATWNMSISRFPNGIWVGDSADTSTVQVDPDDAFIKGTLEVDGVLYADGGISRAAGFTRSFALQLAAGGVDGGYDLDEGSTPDLATCDAVPCLVWADSGETTAVGWTFRLPDDFSSDLVVYALISSNAASGAGQKLDWAGFVNIDDTGFASATAQAAVEATSATLDASNEVLTLTSDATAEALYVAGRWITLEFFNASTDDDDLELKGLEVTYTAAY